MFLDQGQRLGPQSLIECFASGLVVTSHNRNVIPCLRSLEWTSAGIVLAHRSTITSELCDSKFTLLCSKTFCAREKGVERRISLLTAVIELVCLLVWTILTHSRLARPSVPTSVKSRNTH